MTNDFRCVRCGEDARASTFFSLKGGKHEHSDCRVRFEERAKIVAWLRTFPLNKHAREWADAIEAGEDTTPGPDVSGCGGR